MRSAGIVKIQIAANPVTGLADSVVRSQVELLVFDGFPKRLDEHIAAPAATPILADGWVFWPIVTTDSGLLRLI